MAADNVSLGQFNLEGIPPAPRGMPQVEVTFDIDANGILHVGARDQATGREQKITITASTNLAKEDIDRMVRQAEINKAADERRKELVGARNEADSLAYATEKSLRDLDGAISTDDRRALEQLIAEVRRAAQGEDITAIREGMTRLQQATNRLSQSAAGATGAHSQQWGVGGGGNGHDAPPEAGEGEDVVEGEFRQV